MQESNSLRMNHISLDIHRSSEVSHISSVIIMLPQAESRTQTKDYNKPPAYTEISPHT
jgi:hypothetical protein